ncbi:MAG: hypothetical protein ABIO55_14240 [Ginsengibacter sp.]
MKLFTVKKHFVFLIAGLMGVVSGKRSYNIFIPSFPTYPPSGPDKIVFNDEFVAAEIGQVGTQFDGPGHPGP